MLCLLKNVSFKYDEKQILNNINITISSGEIVSIIGPSGAGKTTLLRLLAGIHTDYTGQLRLEPEPTLENPVIIVFQDYMLFPHMTVYQNVAFGLKTRKLKRDDIERRVTEYLEYFGLLEKRDVLPNRLSAGQKQRVAIARAMIVQPALLLLDEPFANLDYNLKAETAEFIRRTQKHFGVTTICVTHDQREAFTISDKIGVLLNGELVEFQTVEELYLRPKSIEAAEFLGPVNHIPQKYLEDFKNCESLPDRDLYTRANGIELSQSDSGPAIVSSAIYRGELVQYLINHRDINYTVSSTINNLQIGDRVALYLRTYIERS